MGVANTTLSGILRLSVKGEYLYHESDVYDGLRLRFSIYTHNRVLEFRSGTTCDTPLESLRDRTWSDVRDLSTYRKTGDVTAQIPPTPEVLVQATSWHRNAQGKIELIADKSPTYLQQRLTCAALRKI